MGWFFFALIGPFLYALTNHIDKILLEKYFKYSGVGTLILISSLLSALALPFIYFLDPTVVSTELSSIAVMCFVGVLNALVIWLYLLALKDDEASIVIVFYQLVPVIGAILGYYFLGEALTKNELIAMAIIILGTTIVSFEIDSDNKFKLRKQTVLLMLGASFCWAAGAAVFKAVALEESVLRTLFWENISLTLIGIITFTFVKKYRVNFLKALRTNSKPILALNLSNEVLYISGNFVFGFAYMMAPIGLILLMNSFQPIFVFAIGAFLTIFLPKISSEKNIIKHVIQKLLAIIITGVGTILLLSV